MLEIVKNLLLGEAKGDHTPIRGKDTKSVMLAPVYFADQPRFSTLSLFGDRLYHAMRGSDIRLQVRVF